jgi:hypothetical protein
MLVDLIRLHFRYDGRMLTRPTLLPLLFLLVQDLGEGVLEPQAMNFKASDHYVSNFLRRVGLSFWRARAHRPPALDEEELWKGVATLLR